VPLTQHIPALEVLARSGVDTAARPVLAPVVFTSALDLGELFADNVIKTFGEPVWIVSQGPQVLLDAQVTELRGGLLLNWDVRESAFPRGLIEAMFATFTEAVRNDSERATRAGMPGLRRGFPSAQAEVRHRGQRHGRPGQWKVVCIKAFFEHAAANPDAPAVVWGLHDSEGAWTYRNLAEAVACRRRGAAPPMVCGQGDAVRRAAAQGGGIRCWLCWECSPPEGHTYRSDSTSRNARPRQDSGHR